MQSLLICPKCKCPIMVIGGTPECCCGIPEEEFYIPTSSDPPYINHCWNCGATIDSRVCIRSLNPTMGFHCEKCGEDLTKWKSKQHKDLANFVRADFVSSTVPAKLIKLTR